MNAKNKLILPDITNSDPDLIYNFFNENCLYFLERKYVESIINHKDLEILENNIIFKFNANKIVCSSLSGILKLYINFAIINENSPFTKRVLCLKEEVKFPHPFVIFLRNLKENFKREIDIFHILNNFKEFHNSHIFEHRIFMYQGIWNDGILEPNLKEVFEESGIIFSN